MFMLNSFLKNSSTFILVTVTSRQISVLFLKERLCGTFWVVVCEKLT